MEDNEQLEQFNGDKEEEKNTPKKYKKKPNLDTKTARYFLARQAGNNQAEALKAAGYGVSNSQPGVIEKSEEYKEIKEYFKDHLLKQISLEGIAKELIKNIEQDKDKGAKNTAIKMALDKIEPEAGSNDNDDQVLVVLSPIKAIEVKERKVIDVEDD